MKIGELEAYRFLTSAARKLANLKSESDLDSQLIGNVLAIVKIMTEEKLLNLDAILVAADARVKELGFDKE